MKTVALQLTGPGVGAIAVILLAGENAAAIIGTLTHGRAKIPTPASTKISHTPLYDPATTKDSEPPPLPIDDALIIRIADDRFELHLHGGTAVVQSILHILQQSGAVIITPDAAADLHLLGTSHLQNQIALAMPHARTLTAAKLLAAQLHTGITTWSNHWQNWLQKTPRQPDQLWPLHAAARWLLARSRALARLLHPPRIALIGPPNAGKSTLANALLGRPISITSNIPGTTRDWVDAQAIFTHHHIHIAVTLVDTAGLRETADPLEQLSIARTHQQAAAADLIILLLDATQPPRSEQHTLLQTYQHLNPIIALNKIDAIENPSDPLSSFILHPSSFPPLPISAKTNQGLDCLMSAVLTRLDLHEIGESEPFAFTESQRTILDQLSLSFDPTQCAALLASFAKNETH